MAIRFLVVDDATFIRDTIKKQLRDRIPGCEVYDATDGSKAVSQLRKQHVDVILSDWEMPGMTGEEFLCWVRSQEALKDTPFIMVTSRGDKDHVVKAVQSGVSDFITKPFSSDELLRKVHKQLQKIGKSPKDAFSESKTGRDTGFGSIDVLTGGGKATPPTASSAVSESVSALTGGSSSAAVDTKKSSKPVKPASKARAQLRFPKLTCACVVRDITLKSFSGLMPRQDALPYLFDQAVVDIEIGDGTVARVNGYLSSMAAGENKMDTKIIKFTIQFVDNDPDKFEALSKFISKSR